MADNSAMPEENGKIIAIQLLRAVAAFLVAITHLAFAYADHIGPGLGIPRLGGHLAQGAVALFFVISGYIMFISSRDMSASPAATRTFWIRRCVRIFPPYWIATLLLVAITLYLGGSVEGRALITSLALIPTDAAEFEGRPQFLLWPGWTLFYEMAFYLLFGAGLRWGRLVAAAFATIAIAALVLAGMVFPPESAILISLTRPVMLIFILGLALAVFRGSGRTIAPGGRWIALALAILAYFTVPWPEVGTALDTSYVLWAGLPAFLVAVAVLGGPIRISYASFVDRLGDASYAVYLLHVPLAIAAISIFPLRLGAWPFLIFTLVGVYVASILAFSLVEKPLTRHLNARLVPRSSSNDRLLQETGV